LDRSRELAYDLAPEICVFFIQLGADEFKHPSPVTRIRGG
jgi:hypothetical protein